MNDNNIDHFDDDLTPEWDGTQPHSRYEPPSASQTFWQRKRYVLLIGAGVIIFGAIIADRLASMRSAEEIPDTASVQRERDISVQSEVDSGQGAQTSPDTLAGADTVASADAVQDTLVSADDAADDSTVVPEEVAQAPQTPPLTDDASDYNEPMDIEALFGSRLVFVSASEPQYVITEDERRIDLGSSIDELTTLAGINGQQLILEKGGDLLIVDLPAPSAQ